MENPFNYLQFATGDRFYDREEIRRDLRSRFLSGQTNVVLYGPRRYGKSSLVAALTAKRADSAQCRQQLSAAGYDIAQEAGKLAEFYESIKIGS